MNTKCPLLTVCSLPRASCNTDCKTYTEEKALHSHYAHSCIDCGKHGCLCKQHAQEEADEEMRRADVISADVGRFLNNAIK